MYDGKIFKDKRKMKYSGHESFNIRKDWLAKGIRKVDSFKKDEFTTMDELGIGKNMVKSLRYWLKVTGLTIDEPKKKQFELSEVGKIIQAYDPYTEELGTLWLLQYSLATSINNATAWYYFFNEFNQTEFTADDFFLSIKKWDGMNNSKPASDSSLVKDFDCLRRTYLSRLMENDNKEEFDPESNMECPFAELGLLKLVGKGLYRKSSPLRQNIPALIVFAVILDQANGLKEIKISSLLNDINNVGKIFNLDTILLITILSDLENKNLVQVVRTAGLDVLRIKAKMTFIECIKKYYEELENE